MTVVKNQPEEDAKYDWVIVFRKGERRIYTYMSRTMAYMSAAVQKSYDKNGTYPYRMWVIVDDEIQKVVIE